MLAFALLAGSTQVSTVWAKLGQTPQTSQAPPAQATQTGQPPVTAARGGRGGDATRPPQGGRSGFNVRPDSTPWWKDEAIKKEIVLRDDQVRRLDGLYDKRAKDIAPLNEELQKQRVELDRMMVDRSVTPAAIELQVAKMEVPRAKMNESYFVMIHRMYLILDPEQNKKLEAIFARQREGGRGRSGGGN
jgi:Spy/CpxP family protein refolding chaperone